VVSLIKTIIAFTAQEFDEKVNEAEQKLVAEGYNVVAGQSHCKDSWFCCVLVYKRGSFK